MPRTAWTEPHPPWEYTVHVRATLAGAALLAAFAVAPGCYLAHERPSDAAVPDACGSPAPGVSVQFLPALPGPVHAMPVTLVDDVWDPAGTRWQLDSCAGAGCRLDMIFVGWHEPNPGAPYAFPGLPRDPDLMAGTLDWDGRTAALRIGDPRRSRGGMLVLAGVIGACCDASLMSTPPGHVCALGCGEITEVLASAPVGWATTGGVQYETCPMDDLARNGVVIGATYEFSTGH